MQIFHTIVAQLFSIRGRILTRIRPYGVRRHSAAAAALIAFFKASLACAATIGPGFSAMWFDPARNGEGLQLEILDADHALVEWYTYDGQGNQRWFQGV